MESLSCHPGAGTPQPQFYPTQGQGQCRAAVMPGRQRDGRLESGAPVGLVPWASPGKGRSSSGVPAGPGTASPRIGHEVVVEQIQKARSLDRISGNQGSCSLSSLTRPPPQLPPQLREFEIGEILGEGAFAIVWKVRQRGNSLALKCVEKQPLAIRDMLAQLQREVRIHSSMRHPNILRMQTYIEDEAYVYMLLEHCPGGSIRGLCATMPNCRLSEPRASRYFRQTLHGVDYMHQRRVVHRDLKPENLLLSGDDEVRICDFGWASELSDKALCAACGTPCYWAPEIFENLPQDAGVDLWTLGIMIFEVLVGHPPFWGTDDEMRAKILAVDLRYPPGLLSSDAIDVFHSLIKRSAKSRVPAARLLVEHPWLQSAESLQKSPRRQSTAQSYTPPQVHRAGAVVAVRPVAGVVPAGALLAPPPHALGPSPAVHNGAPRTPVSPCMAAQYRF